MKMLLIAFLGLGLGQLSSCSSGQSEESTGQYIDSAAITAKVKTALIKSKLVDAGDITVETYKSNVQLSGFVRSAKQKTEAERLTQKVEGVDSVTNSIVVK